MEEIASTPAAGKRGKSRLRRWGVRILRGGLLVYLGVVVVIYFLQTKLIFPGAERQGQKDTILMPSARYELLTLPVAGGEKVTALFGKALESSGQPRGDAGERPTLIFFYGNYSSMADSSEEFDRFRRLGFNVIVPDYLGYGMSGGTASEANCYATADVAYDYLLSRKDIDPKKIVATGWSLGGAVAIDLAARRKVCGVITFSAFSRMKDMAHLVIPWVPTSLILRHHFDNLAKVGKINCPILIMHGQVDSIIPPEMSGQLEKAATGPVTRILVSGADHNDIFQLGGEGLLGEVSKFVEGLK